jgi:hypothetical protein
MHRESVKQEKKNLRKMVGRYRAQLETLAFLHQQSMVLMVAW